MAVLTLVCGATWVGFDLHGVVRPPEYFESEIRAFERADAADPPQPGQVLFLGSSSIRRWSSLERDMAPFRVLNRGFGGSQLEHVIHFFDRIVAPYKPRAIVLYEGDNDLAGDTGKDSDDVFEDFELFVTRVREALPETRVHFLSIKPSPTRWHRWSEMSAANQKIADWSKATKRLDYIDVASVLLGSDGRPRADFFLTDGIHLNPDGYRAWATIVRRAIAPQQPADAK